MMRTALIICVLCSSACGQNKVFLSTTSDTVCEVRFPKPFHGESRGSGSLIEADLVLSCAHGVSGSECVVMFHNKAERGQAIALDLFWDWSLIRLDEPKTTKPLRLRDEVLRDGEAIRVVGFGGGYGFHSGVFSVGKFFASAIGGDSGGPILDSQGQICGVTQAVVNDAPSEVYGYNFANLKKWVQDNRQNKFLKISSGDYKINFK